MQKAIITPDEFEVPEGLPLCEFISMVHFLKRNATEIQPYERSIEAFAAEVNVEFGDNRWVRIVDSEEFTKVILERAERLLDNQPIGTKVNFNENDTFGSIVLLPEGYLFTLDGKTASISKIKHAAGLLEAFINERELKFIDIDVELQQQDDFLFDIYSYATKMEIAMLNQLFDKHQVDGTMHMSYDEYGDPFRMAVLSGMGYDTVEILGINRSESGFFTFVCETETGDGVTLNYEDLPPKGVAYLIEFLVRHNN